ncbi:hypothetical protein CR513_27688, partial [Mucuna pruriens]
MLGLDTTIVEHRLPPIPNTISVQQQLRRIKPKVTLKIKEEVDKQWNAGFLVIAKYTQRVANIVPIPKKDEKVRMCVDYKDLNWASPKDNFPLPHIDILVDNTTQHAFYSFMDSFSRYNQIQMVVEDREKTTFITTRGTFCYKVIPFKLKNAGATYQRPCLRGRYDSKVEDAGSACGRPEKALRETMKIQAQAKPNKMHLWGQNRKVVGFQSQRERGIEVDPDKVKAIWNMTSPRTKTEVKGFLGRFTSQLIDTCIPIFKLAQKNQKMEWNDECRQTILGNTSRPRPGNTREAPNPLPNSARRTNELSSGATRHLKKERIGHILSQQEIHKLRTKIPNVGVNVLCSSLDGKKVEAVHAGPYYVAHSQDGPPQVYLQKTNIDRADSTLENGFTSQKAIKGSALAEKLAHHSLDDYQPRLHEFPDEHILSVEEVGSESELARWKLWFDRASNLLGNGIGAVLTSLEGQCFPFSARLGFNCTNDMAEYKACAIRITMAIEHQVEKLKVFSDLVLVIYQLRGEWETRDAKLIPYHDHVMEMIEHFDKITFYYVPRDENQMADALATLSSMLLVNKE